MGLAEIKVDRTHEGWEGEAAAWTCTAIGLTVLCIAGVYYSLHPERIPFGGDLCTDEFLMVLRALTVGATCVLFGG